MWGFRLICIITEKKILWGKNLFLEKAALLRLKAKQYGEIWLNKFSWISHSNNDGTSRCALLITLTFIKHEYRNLKPSRIFKGGMLVTSSLTTLWWWRPLICWWQHHFLSDFFPLKHWLTISFECRAVHQCSFPEIFHVTNFWLSIENYTEDNYTDSIN